MGKVHGSRRSYTFRVLVSLGLLALIAAFGTFTQQRFLTYTGTMENRWVLSTRVYNQVLMLSSLLRNQSVSNNANERNRVLQQLENQIIKLTETHADIAINARSKVMRELYYGEGRLDEETRRFISIAKAGYTALKNGARTLPVSVDKSLQQWLQSEGLERLRLASEQFQLQMEESRTKLFLWNYLMGFALLLTLLIQYFGVFRPMGFEIFENGYQEKNTQASAKTTTSAAVIQFPLGNETGIQESQSSKRKSQ